MEILIKIQILLVLIKMVKRKSYFFCLVVLSLLLFGCNSPIDHTNEQQVGDNFVGQAYKFVRPTISSKNTLKESNCFDGKDDEDVIQLSKDRHEIGKKFLILEKLQDITSSKKSQKFSVLIPSKTNLEISDTDIFINKDEIGLQDDEIETILKELEEEGTIIIQTV